MPASFSPERPAVALTHETHDTPIAAHPLASRIPRPTNAPAMLADPDEFTPLSCDATTPTSIDSYLLEDRPQVGMHVVSFEDATLVTMHWLHATFDAVSWAAIFDAWQLVLAGREDEIKTPTGVEVEVEGGKEQQQQQQQQQQQTPAATAEGTTASAAPTTTAPPTRNLLWDPTSELGKDSSRAQHVLGDRLLNIGGMVGYGLRNIVSLGVRARENRVLCFPAWFVEHLHARCLAELRDEGETDPWLSHGDVLTAWWTRMAVSHLPDAAASARTVTLGNAMSYRRLLFPDISADREAPYLGNAVAILTSIMPASEITTCPLGRLARVVRRTIQQQGTREQVDAYHAILRESPKNKMLPMFGDTAMYPITFSNWTKAHFFGVDFADAVVGGRHPGRPVTARYVQNIQTSLKFPDALFILGRDGGGNYWFSGYRVQGLWQHVEREMKVMEEAGWEQPVKV
jgi:hypothetical protein